MGEGFLLGHTKERLSNATVRPGKIEVSVKQESCSIDAERLSRGGGMPGGSIL